MKRQRGAALFVSLIALVVMSLVGVAMSRNIDTALGVVGNLSFSQNALAGTNIAVAEAIAWIEHTKVNGSLNTDIPSQGYFSSAANNRDWRDQRQWEDAVSWSAQQQDSMGNELRYKIERVCESPGVHHNIGGCVFGAPPTASGVGNTLTNAFRFQPPPQLLFRITARAVGPKNSQTIVQAYYLTPM